MNASIIVLLLGFAVATTIGPAAAQSNEETSARLEFLYGEHEPYEDFFIALKRAVAKGDRKAVAAVLSYPFETRIGGRPVTLRSADDFLGRYDDLFTPAVVSALDGQTYAALFANAEGVMIGHGEIWFSGVCGDEACSDVTVRIIAINVPDARSE